MAGKKRTRTGEIKPQPTTNEQSDIPMTTNPPHQTPQNPHSKPKQTSILKPPQKLPKLPKNTSLHKRPLLRPALPTPYNTSSAPKTLYITASSPFIPCVKRIRALLSEINKRAAQSDAARRKGGKQLEANGRLKSGDVERGIVDAVGVGMAGKSVGKTAGRIERGEKVYVKATGRAIPRALAVGVHFQAETDCVVRVEMGSVRAIDDLEVGPAQGDEVGGNGEEEGGEVPETRVRTVSSVTVSIGLKE